MAGVKQKFTADAKDLEREHARIQKSLEKIDQRMDKLARTTKKTEDTKKTFGASATRMGKQVTGSLKNIAAGYLGLQTVIQGVIASNQKFAEQSRAAMNANMTLAQSQKKVNMNIGDIPRTQKIQFLDQLAAIQKRVGFESVAPINAAAAEILSGTGGDRQRTLGIVEVAASLMGSDPSQTGVFGGAIADIMKKTGLEDPQRVGGLMLAILGQSRFKDLSGFKKVAPALAGVQKTNKGMNQLLAARQGAALFAAIGGEIGDVDGALTSTAVTNLSANLENVVGGNLTLFERIQKVRQNPELRDEVMKSGFEAATKATVRELLTGSGGQTGAATAAAFEKIKDSVGLYRRTAADDKYLTSQMQVKTRADQFSGVIEQFQTGPGQARLGEARRYLQETLNQTALNMAGNMIETPALMAQFDNLRGKKDPAQWAIELLHERRDEILQWGDPVHRRGYMHVSKERQEAVQLINQTVRILREMNTKKAGGLNNARQRIVNDERD